MAASKLHERMESVEWSPPHLQFTIERHGGTVHGSTRADLQRWDVNVQRGTATLIAGGVRQLRKLQRRLDVTPLADTIAALVLAGADDPRLHWSADRRGVQVQIARVIPAASASQTITSRRKRFRVALDEKLKTVGWYARSPNRYHRG